MLVGSDEMCVQLSDRVMRDPIVGKRVWFCDIRARGGEAAGTGCREFHEMSTEIK